MIQFFVPGTPAPGGSKQGFYNKKLKRVLMVPASKKTKPWMQAVQVAARQAYSGELLTGPIVLTITFQFLRPKRHYRTGRYASLLKPTAETFVQVKPDLTKIIRSTEDAMKGIIWRDDSQVVKQNTQKFYVERDPGAFIHVKTVP